MSKLFPRRLSAVLSHIRDLSTSINTIDYVFARVGRALLQVLPNSNAPAISYLCGYPNFFYDGAIFIQLNIVILNPDSTWRPINHFNKIILSNTTVYRSAQFKPRTCVNQLVLRDDWTRNQSNSSCPLPKPWLFHT